MFCVFFIFRFISGNGAVHKAILFDWAAALATHLLKGRWEANAVTDCAAWCTDTIALIVVAIGAVGGWRKVGNGLRVRMFATDLSHTGIRGLSCFRESVIARVKILAFLRRETDQASFDL